MDVETRAGASLATSPPQDVRTDVRTEVRQQVQQSVEATRIEQAEMRERIRAAVEQARAAEQARMEAMQGSAVGQVLVPPPPQSVQILDGRVIVDGRPVARVGTSVPPRGRDEMPLSEGTIRDIAMGFFMMVAFIAVGIPFIRLLGRWMERRHVPPAAIAADMSPRLERIEQAVEAVAIEVERISEGQRFTSRLISELRAAPQLERVTEQRS